MRRIGLRAAASLVLLVWSATVEAADCTSASSCAECVVDKKCGWCTGKTGCVAGDLLGPFSSCAVEDEAFRYGGCTEDTSAYSKINFGISAASIVGGLVICFAGYRHIVMMLACVSFFTTAAATCLTYAKLVFFSELTYSPLFILLASMLLGLLGSACTLLSYNGRIWVIFFKIAVFQLGLLAGILLVACILSFRINSWRLLTPFSNQSAVLLIVAWGSSGLIGTGLGLGCLRGHRKAFMMCVSWVGAGMTILGVDHIVGYYRDDDVGLKTAIQRVLATHVQGTLESEDWGVIAYVLYGCLWLLAVVGFVVQSKVTASKGLRHLTPGEVRRLQASQFHAIDDQNLQQMRRVDPRTGEARVLSYDNDATELDEASDFDDSIEVIRSARRRLQWRRETSGIKKALAAVGLMKAPSDSSLEDYEERARHETEVAERKLRKARRAAKVKSKRSTTSSSQSSRRRSRDTEIACGDDPPVVVHNEAHEAVSDETGNSEENGVEHSAPLKGAARSTWQASPPPLPLPSDEPEFTVRSAVEVYYENDGWYRAVVTAFDAPARTYTVTYDTGEVSYGVEETFLRRVDI
ncbi:hypothetical protein DIPPA_19904 [Diplonema papillatum]|nr:hypothetical protein DIPPA_19904 [Diplonema papillatum]